MYAPPFFDPLNSPRQMKLHFLPVHHSGTGRREEDFPGHKLHDPACASLYSVTALNRKMKNMMQELLQRTEADGRGCYVSQADESGQQGPI
jgi:hypothetical protein